ncbi:hypothetical protein CEP54_015386 [Fusarium duplospermum]|uniref:GPR1/FUN34/YaaH-class plasma membrane protein n=1 Tax=Fusarium duplospermum TaxID=1325734 RepID=A0A428NPN3_9HYPO|nr:hypothetical protein CEP54_015386 [Fusarium duplospermum]
MSTEKYQNGNDLEGGNLNALESVRSAANITMSSELFEKLYLSPPNAVKGDLRNTFGNPTPMGLIGFLIALMPLSCSLMGWRGSGSFGAAAIPVYFFMGGFLMVLSGILEWVLGNSFPSIVFCSLGCFWLSLGGVLNPSFGAFSFYAPPDAQSSAEGLATRGFNASLGFWLLAMGILALVFLVCALRTNVAFVVIFATLVPALFLLAGAFWVWAEDYAGNAKLAQRLCEAAGACLFVTCFAGWYVLIAIMFAILEFPVQIPIGDLSTVVVRGRRSRANRG